MSDPEDSGAAASTIERELERLNGILRLENEQPVRQLYGDAQRIIDRFGGAPVTTVSTDGDTTITKTAPTPTTLTADGAPYLVYLYSAATTTAGGHTTRQIGLRYTSDDPETDGLLQNVLSITPDGALRVFEEGVPVINDLDDIRYARQTVKNIERCNRDTINASAARNAVTSVTSDSVSAKYAKTSSKPETSHHTRNVAVLCVIAVGGTALFSYGLSVLDKLTSSKDDATSIRDFDSHGYGLADGTISRVGETAQPVYSASLGQNANLAVDKVPDVSSALVSLHDPLQSDDDFAEENDVSLESGLREVDFNNPGYDKNTNPVDYLKTCRTTYINKLLPRNAVLISATDASDGVPDNAPVKSLTITMSKNVVKTCWDPSKSTSKIPPRVVYDIVTESKPMVANRPKLVLSGADNSPLYP